MLTYSLRGGVVGRGKNHNDLHTVQNVTKANLRKVQGEEYSVDHLNLSTRNSQNYLWKAIRSVRGSSTKEDPNLSPSS